MYLLQREHQKIFVEIWVRYGYDMLLICIVSHSKLLFSTNYSVY